MASASVLKDKVLYRVSDASSAAHASRLNDQHGLILRTCEGNLLPAHVLQHLLAIPSTQGRPAAVADIATGTAIWLRDLASLLPPDTRLDGYDHDETKFGDMRSAIHPNAEPMPARIHCFKQDMFNPFPEEAQGAYDVVHIRLIMFALSVDQWGPLVDHFAKLLRPGGWLVWEENNAMAHAALPFTPSWARFRFLLDTYALREGRDPAATIRLPRRFKEAHLQSVSQQIFHSLENDEKDPAGAKEALRTSIQGGRVVLLGLLRGGKVEGLQSEEDIDALLTQIREDWEGGVIKTNAEWAVTSGREAG